MLGKNSEFISKEKHQGSLILTGVLEGGLENMTSEQRLKGDQEVVRRGVRFGDGRRIKTTLGKVIELCGAGGC